MLCVGRNEQRIGDNVDTVFATLLNQRELHNADFKVTVADVSTGIRARVEQGRNFALIEGRLGLVLRAGQSTLARIPVAALEKQAVFAADIPALREILAPVLTAPVSIAESGTEVPDIAYCTIDTAADVRALYLVNLNKNDGHAPTITLPGHVRVSRLPMDTLSAAPLSCVR